MPPKQQAASTQEIHVALGQNAFPVKTVAADMSRQAAVASCSGAMPAETAVADSVDADAVDADPPNPFLMPVPTTASAVVCPTLVHSEFEPPNPFLSEPPKLSEALSRSEDVFQRMALLDGDSSNPLVLRKAELIEAHYGDHRVFQQLKSDANGNITLEAWRDWITATHKERGAKGDQWCAGLNKALSLHNNDLEEKSRQAAKDAARWTEIEAETEALFHRIAGLGDDDSRETISKAELADAHYGDYGVFQEMDADESGQVTLEEWHAW